MIGRLRCWFTRGILPALLLGFLVAPAPGLPLLADHGGPNWNIDLGKETLLGFLFISDELPRTTLNPTECYAGIPPGFEFADHQDDGRCGPRPGGSFDLLTSNLHTVWGFDDPSRNRASVKSPGRTGDIEAERGLTLTGQTDIGRAITIRPGQPQKSTMRREPTIQPSPEPISLVLLLAGLLGVGAISRRKET